MGFRLLGELLQSPDPHPFTLTRLRARSLNPPTSSPTYPRFCFAGRVGQEAGSGAGVERGGGLGLGFTGSGELLPDPHPFTLTRLRARPLNPPLPDLRPTPPCLRPTPPEVASRAGDAESTPAFAGYDGGRIGSATSGWTCHQAGTGIGPRIRSERVSMERFRSWPGDRPSTTRGIGQAGDAIGSQRLRVRNPSRIDADPGVERAATLRK